MGFKIFYLIAIIWANSLNVAISTKYGHISKCQTGYQSINSNVYYYYSYFHQVYHFLCESTNLEDNIFQSNYTSCTQNYSNVVFRAIDFHNCQFSRFERNYFQIYPNLFTLIISDVGLEVLQTEIFDDATKLINLYASQNQISEIPAQLFSKAVQLKIVDLSRNNIEKIDSSAFDGLNSLDYLNLSYNQISEILPTTLNLPHLQVLDLSYNKINALSDHSFDNASALKQLYLMCNPIGNLKVDTFAYLSDLENLNLRRTNISSIILGTFSHQHRLVGLDLSENSLKYLDFGLFFPILQYLQSLRLSGNELTDLSGFRNSLFPSLIQLDIKNNRFNCTYLKKFMDSVDWRQIFLMVDPKSMNLQQASIRGVNCEEIDIPEDEKENANLNDKSEKSNDRINIILDDSLFVKFLLFFIFVIILGLFIVFILLNKNKLYTQCSLDKFNIKSDELNESLMELK